MMPVMHVCHAILHVSSSSQFIIQQEEFFLIFLFSPGRGVGWSIARSFY